MVLGCYVGLMFNILVGLGLFFLFVSWKFYFVVFVILIDYSLFYIIGFLYVGLLWVMFILLMWGMIFSKGFGIGLLVLYVFFFFL